MTISANFARRWLAASLAAVLVLAGCAPQDGTGPGGNPLLEPGQGATLNATTTLTLEGGSAGMENVLVIVDTATKSGAAKFAYQVTTTGTGPAGAISGPATALNPLPDGTRGAEAEASPSTPALDIAYGMRLNARNRARFTRRFQAARAAYSARRATPGVSRNLGIVDPQLGDIFTVNVSTNACSQIVSRSARVVAIGTKSIVLSDTQNPSGGFTAADFQRFAARFDTLVYPLEVANFGAPVDIDENDKIILLFTTAVNELTPQSSTSYVAGFFFDRDLFPIVTTPDFGEGCPGSNYAELFYLLAPDPTGLVNKNVRSTGFVDSVTTAVVAHEFQHLINASRRVYVTQGASEFEVTWLNEGLSHIAEELLFLHEADLTSRRNLDAPTIRDDPEIRSAFNADMSSNAARYREFLEKPSENSPFSDDDSLETRGATWNLLRYLADQKGGSDAETWQALVNTPRVGMANLGAVFGSDIGAKVRNWNVSHYMDDLVSGLSSEFTQPSWNFHSIFAALSTSGSYPLEVKTLTAGNASGTLIGGAAAYYRFSIPANTTATITLSGSGATALDARVFRIR